jgi:hypothetical protein
VVNLESGELEHSFPDMSCQGGCDALDGNQGVIEVFTSKRVANRYLRYLKDSDPDDTNPKLAVREIRLTVVAEGGLE